MERLPLAAAILGGFAIVGAIGAWSGSRSCTLSGAVGASAVVYVGLMALVALAFWTDSPAGKEFFRSKAAMVGAIAGALVVLYLMAEVSGAIAKTLGC